MNKYIETEINLRRRIDFYFTHIIEKTTHWVTDESTGVIQTCLAKQDHSHHRYYRQLNNLRDSYLNRYGEYYRGKFLYKV